MEESSKLGENISNAKSPVDFSLSDQSNAEYDAPTDEDNLSRDVSSQSDTNGDYVDLNEQKPISQTIGYTWNGDRQFKVPETDDLLNRIFNFKKKKNFFELVAIYTCVFLIALYLYKIPKELCLALFICFRLSYNLGLGILLSKQSSSNYMVRLAERYGFGKLKEGQKRNFIVKFLITQITMTMRSMGNEYDYDSMPLEFNTWVMYRGLVDLILATDVVTYTLFSLSYMNSDWHNFTFLDVLRYAGGALLLFLSTWVKGDARRVIKDYAWYWGDFFFRVDSNLNFDGVFELAPHPMYSLGYVSYYGIALITKSYCVLFASILAHTCQLLFLKFVETPHIEKVYKVDTQKNKTFDNEIKKYFEGDSSTIICNITNTTAIVNLFAYLQISLLSFAMGDVKLLPWKKYFFIFQALFWFFLRTYGVGFILWKQSRYGSWMKFFLDRGKNEVYAFRSWRIIYDFIHTQSYLCFIIMCIKLVDMGSLMNSSMLVVRIVLGVFLGVLQLWTTYSALQDIGISGWYYADFFLKDFKYKGGPVYTGIYRYTDDPMLYMTFLWGVALVCNMWIAYMVVIFGQASMCIMTHYVEKPHLKRIYSGKVRSMGGAERVILREVDKIQFHTKKALEAILSDIEGKNKLNSIKNLIAGQGADLKKMLGANSEPLRVGIFKMIKDLSKYKEVLKENKQQIKNEMKKVIETASVHTDTSEPQSETPASSYSPASQRESQEDGLRRRKE